MAQIKPTLAFNIEDKEKHVVFPALIQPKLDGVRCVAEVVDGRARLYSRVGNEITCLPHIVAELESSYTDCILDGELYNHKFRDDFNAVVSRVKRIEPHPQCTDICLFVYDRVTSGDYNLRTSGLKYGRYLKQVETKKVTDREDLDREFRGYLEQGYEGAMYRNPSANYEHKRSPSLLKMKKWFDEEYEVVDVLEGKGKLVGKAGAILFRHSSGRTFKAKPSGDYDLIKEYLDNKDYYIGKLMTVKYQNLTPAGVPRFGTVLRLREDI